ncbi:hypothetical protein GCM10020221_34840 [Streptomyces thioluteus]|uniref:Uncharacterized protein n=1 Tax=Streptomyces thioluteus TaxID=66431 RepID=A0ABN3X376_STRTU
MPDTWDCPRCGFPPARTGTTLPDPPRTEPYKTPPRVRRERRSDADGEAILAEALASSVGDSDEPPALTGPAGGPFLPAGPVVFPGP